ncbi:hypothetical protein SUGI_0196920 [Cryptomeria japonica]|uniref:stress-response A/B barrel domain-containing protein UP3 n=1 Tax=Cryptomeria japonica TaxID=3369 RepID=UPI002408E5A7|nr:stress-response A/B barrel domain-containing protein UP3 [Cryptomeria japonica]GLJ12739.1 hypothetical protein SUGI_0196920 [Cryptomeria japonica]
MMMRLGNSTASLSSGNFREAAVGIFSRRRSLFTSLHTPLGWCPCNCKSGKISRCVFPEQKISRSKSKLSTVSANMSLPSKVIEHIVFFKVKDGTPPEKANAMVSALQGLKSLDTVLQLTVGPVLHVTSETYNFTHALHSRYKDKQSLADYSGHPRHLSVVKELVLPITDDIFAFDWEADLDGPMIASYGALKFTVFNPKDLAQPQWSELTEILSGYKSTFPTIGQVSFGENFSPARAKGFTWGLLSLFPGIKELDELNKNAEHIQLQGEKILPQMEKFMVVDMTTSPNPANL